MLVYAAKNGVDLDVGLSEAALGNILDTLPTGIAWAAQKAGGTAAIMRRCDLDNDGFVRGDELLRESACIDSCWKQVAIGTFL